MYVIHVHIHVVSMYVIHVHIHIVSMYVIHVHIHVVSMYVIHVHIHVVIMYVIHVNCMNPVSMVYQPSHCLGVYRARGGCLEAVSCIPLGCWFISPTPEGTTA